MPLDGSCIPDTPSGFQIPFCPVLPDFCIPEGEVPDCKKTRSSMESSGFRLSPENSFRFPACHSLNTCWDPFCKSRFCLDFGIRFQAFASFRFRYTVGSLDAARYSWISSSICASTSPSIQASQFFFFFRWFCSSIWFQSASSSSSCKSLCFRFVSFNLIDFTYFI